MERLRDRLIEYLAVYPSVGILRLAGDLKVPLSSIEEVIRELEREGLVEYLDELGVVNFIPWKEGLVEAGYKLKERGDVEEGVSEKRRKRGVTLLDFA